MVILNFDTWEEFDNAIAGITTITIALNKDEPFECARCGSVVATGDYHPEIGCDY